MRSMTGFGTATETRGGMSATVEARSVNNRYLKVSLRCPHALSAREHEIEAVVRKRAERGTVYVVVRITRENPEIRVRLNEKAAGDYHQLLSRLAETAEGEVNLSLLARLPGVFETEDNDSGILEEDWETVRDTVEAALERLVEMRDAEGANLLRDFTDRAATITRIVSDLEGRSPEVVSEFGQRLEERVTALIEGRGVNVEEADLIRELAVFAERSDVTEEVTRLKSHLEQFGRAIAGEGSLGRRLDFLIQEMMREANTISAKASDVEMSRLCVDLKVELDRLKEQVQNVE